MIKTTDEQVNELSPEDRANFLETLEAVLNDSTWLAFRGLEGTGDEMVKMVLYGEMFENDSSYLHRGKQEN